MAAYRWNGYATQGGLALPLSQLGSSSSAMRSYPGARVAVYLAGTATLAALYRDAAATLPLSNPFTADDAAYAFFYADAGVYTIEFSSAGITVPFSAPDVILGTDFNVFTFNVRAFGARSGIDCTAAFTAAWAAAAATSGRAAIYIPADTADYIITTAMTAFEGKPVRVYGDGIYASTVKFNPTAANTGFATWQPAAGQTTINFVQADNFGIESDVLAKGLVTIGTSFGSYFHHLRIQMTFPGSTAHEIQGWDTTKISDVFYNATYPIAFKKVTVGAGTGSGQCDYFKLDNAYLFSSDDTQPLISFESGVVCSNLSVNGGAWVGGSDGFKFVSTGAFNNNAFANIRWENGNTQIATPVLHGRMFDIEPASGSMLRIENCSGGSVGAQGPKLRNLSLITLSDWSFTGSWTSSFNQVDIDNSCNLITFDNAVFADIANATRTLGNQLFDIFAATPNNGTAPTLSSFAHYVKLSGLGPDYQLARIFGQEVWKTFVGPNMPVTSVAAGASVSLPTPGNFKAPGMSFVSIIVNHATLTDATEEYGLFATGWFGPHLLAGSANIAAGDTGGKVSLIYAGAGNAMTVKNNLAVPIRVKVLVN